MNYLSRRYDSARAYSGKRYYKNIEIDKQMMKKYSGYVMQEDVLNPNFTLLETIEFHANLRLWNKSNEFKEQIIEDLLNSLGLTQCINVFVGDSVNKGISGGEKKRLCILLEFLTNPKILFLDEPTSGNNKTYTISSMIFLSLNLNKRFRFRKCIFGY